MIINLLDKSDAGFSRDWMSGLAQALTAQLTKHVAPAFGLEAWSVIYAPTDAERFPGGADLVFVQNADVANALGYHVRPKPGVYLGTMFVEEIAANLTAPETTASHEAIEMAVDPDCSLAIVGPDGKIRMLEPGDPVEDTTYAIDGFPRYQLSNFVHRAWYLGDTGTTYDQMGVLNSWGARTEGGYVGLFDGGVPVTDPPSAAARGHKTHPSSRTWRRLNRGVSQ